MSGNSSVPMQQRMPQGQRVANPAAMQAAAARAQAMRQGAAPAKPGGAPMARPANGQAPRPNGQNLTPAQRQAMDQRQAMAAQAQARAQGKAPAQAAPDAPNAQAAANNEANHSHIIARTPVYDAHRVVQMYRLRFSSGNKFVTERVLPQHVASIIDDYFIKRSIVNFVGTKAKALIMMPVNPALIPLVKKGVASRLVLQIPSYQEPSVQVVDFMSKIKRFGIRFAVDLMDVMQRGWLKGILHIEYIMINMGNQGAWQLAVFQKLKVKAPWLKIIAYGTSETTLLKMSLSYRADLVISPMSTSTMTFKQSPALLEPFQADIMSLAHELFLPKINFPVFKKYLSENRAILKIIIYHVHRFKKVDLRVLGNLSDIYKYLLESEPIPSFTVILIHGLLTHYTKCVQSSSLHVIDELYRRILIHGYFTEYVVRRMPNASAEDRHYSFQTGAFSLLPEILLKSMEELTADRYLFAITRHINNKDSLVGRTIQCLDDMESNNLPGVFDYAKTFKVPSARLWAAYEDAIIQANEFMISLQVTQGQR